MLGEKRAAGDGPAREEDQLRLSSRKGALILPRQPGWSVSCHRLGEEERHELACTSQHVMPATGSVRKERVPSPGAGGWVLTV